MVWKTVDVWEDPCLNSTANRNRHHLMLLQQSTRTQWCPTARVSASLPTNNETGHTSCQNITPLFCCASTISLCRAKLPPNAESRLPCEALRACTRVPFRDPSCYTTKRKSVLETHHSSEPPVNDHEHSCSDWRGRPWIQAQTVRHGGRESYFASSPRLTRGTSAAKRSFTNSAIVPSKVWGC